MTSTSITSIADRIRDSPPRAGETVVAAIDGPAGSGKTTLAVQLAGALNCAVVHMDDIYPGWDGLAEAATLVADQVLKPLAAGGQPRHRKWDWANNIYAEWVDVPVEPILLIEGCGSASLRGAPYLSLIIWVDAPHDLRMKRGIERDGDTFRPHWKRWARQEDELFAAERTRERADIVIDGTIPIAN